MNNDRRKKIAEAVENLNAALKQIDAAKVILDECKDEEQDAFDNLPGPRSAATRGETMSDNIDYLEEAINALENIE